jgi:hypothetical protein
VFANALYPQDSYEENWLIEFAAILALASLELRCFE